MLEAATVPRRGSGRKGQTKGGAAPGEHRDATPLSNSGRGIVIAKASFDPTSQPSTECQKPRSSLFSRPRKPRSPLQHALPGDPQELPHRKETICALSDDFVLIQTGLRASASIKESRPSAWLRIALIRHSFSSSPITTCELNGGSPSVSSCFN